MNDEEIKEGLRSLRRAVLLEKDSYLPIIEKLNTQIEAIDTLLMFYYGGEKLPKDTLSKNSFNELWHFGLNGYSVKLRTLLRQNAENLGINLDNLTVEELNLKLKGICIEDVSKMYGAGKKSIYELRRYLKDNNIQFSETKNTEE